MIDKILELLIKLLKERETNKQLVLKECLNPLKADIDSLHAHYLNQFHACKRQLGEGKEAGMLMPEVLLALDQAIVSRRKIGGQIAALLHVSNARVDQYEQHALAFTHSAVDYLEGKVWGNLDELLQHPFSLGTLGIPNPYYVRLQNDLRYIESRQKVSESIEQCLVHIQVRHAEVEHNYAKFRAFLLS